MAQSQNNTAAELVIIDTVETKAEEVDDLNKQIESLKKELDTSRIQVSTFSEWVYLTQVFSCFKLAPIIIIVYFTQIDIYM